MAGIEEITLHEALSQEFLAQRENLGIKKIIDHFQASKKYGYEKESIEILEKYIAEAVAGFFVREI
ncbi:MAG: hypothetical protein ACT4OY_04405 [Alphaproteobacteria bacterium]